MSSPTRSRRHGFVAVIIGVVALFATACGDSIPSGAAAVVNGEVVPTELLSRIVDAQLAAAGEAGGPEAGPEQEAELQRQILSALISFEISEDVAEELGVEVTEEELDEAYDEQIGLAGGEEQLESQVSDLGLSVEEYREVLLASQVRQQEIAEELQGDIEVTDREVREEFETRQEAGQYDVAEVSHILIGFGEGVAPGAAEPDPEAEAAAEETANEVLQRLEDGESFEDLATELSDDPGSAAQGGSLGEAPLSQYVPEFAAAAAEAEVGEVVGPVRTQFGYHLIRVDSRDETTFADVEETIREELVQMQSGTEVEDTLLAAVAEADVQVPERFGVWNPETGTVDAAQSPTQDAETGPPVQPGQPGQPGQGTEVPVQPTEQGTEGR